MNKYAYKKIITAKNTFYYLEFGQTHQKTILCLHGYVDTAEIFKDLGLYFESKYRIIALDFPMSCDNNTVYTPDTLTEFVLDFTDRMNLNKFNLFGFSLGGLVAINTAYTSNKVEKLFIANIVPAMINNTYKQEIIKTIYPILITRLFCYLFSKFKTTPLWANKIGVKKDKQTLMRMQQYYYSIFATMFGFGRVDLTKIFNNLSNEKHLFIFRDDEIISYPKYRKQIERLNCNYHLLAEGGHLSKTGYWNNVFSILRHIL